MRDRAYRRHHRARIAARNRRARRLLSDPRAVSATPRDLASRHPLDCGKRCLLCHWGKLLGLDHPRYPDGWRRLLDRDAL